jgi:tetratricopeptide (TPR) repeat protein
MDKVRLQFWNTLKYMSTFLCLIFGVLATLDLTNRMPDGLAKYLKSPPFLNSAGLLPPQFNWAWIPLAGVAVIFVLVARIASRRKRLWRPSSFEDLPAPGGGYLRKVGLAQLKKEVKAGTAEARRQAIESFKSAEIHFSENRYKEAAAEYQKSAFSISTKSAYLNGGVSLCYISHLSRAADAFETGLAIARREKNEKFEGAFLCDIGITQRERGNLTEALAFFKQAYGIGAMTGDSLGQACALGNIGSVYLLQGRIDESIKSSEIVHKNFENASCAASRAAALDNIGNVYSGRGDFKRALKYHRKARKIYRDIRNLPGETQTLANIGYVSLKLGRPRRSLRASRAALKLAERLGSFVDRAKAYGNIGLAYEKKGKLEDALKSIQKSLELYKQVSNPVGIGNQLASMGVIYAAQDKKKEALLKWGEARSKFLQTGAKSDGYHVVETAIEVYIRDNP